MSDPADKRRAAHARHVAAIMGADKSALDLDDAAADELQRRITGKEETARAERQQRAERERMQEEAKR